MTAEIPIRSGGDEQRYYATLGHIGRKASHVQRKSLYERAKGDVDEEDDDNYDEGALFAGEAAS